MGDVLHGVPLLADLTKVELAKLIPSLEIITMEPGALINPSHQAHDAVYCIRDGRAEVLAEVDDSMILLVALGPGDSFGSLIPESKLGAARGVRAQTRLTLVKIAKRPFEDLAAKNPTLQRLISRQLVQRISALERELIRTKLMLKVHAMELFGEPQPDMDLSDQAHTQVAAAYEVPLENPPRAAPPARPSLSVLARWSLVTSILLLIIVRNHVGLSDATTVILTLAWGAVNWYLGLLPDYGVALAMIGTLATTHLAPMDVTLSGYTSETWFLILGIYGLGASINRTGLLYRLALFVLSKLPPTYRGQSLALALTGLLLTPALPSSNGRVTMASPLAHELSMAMRLPPGSKQSAGLALSVLHGFGQMYFLFMNGTGNCLVVWGLLPPEIRQQVSWFSWLLVALPLGLIIFGGFFAALTWLIPADQSIQISRNILEAQVATLGKLSRSERLTLGVMIVVLMGFVFQPLHGIHPAWPAIGGLLFLMAVKVLDRPMFVGDIDWASLVLFGALWSLAAVIRHTGLDVELGSLASGLLAPVAAQPWLFLITLGLMTYLIRIVIPWESAIPLMMVAATPALIAAGYNPFIGGLVILATSNPFFIPQQNVVYLTVFLGTGEQDITHQQAARFGFVHAAITLVAVILSTWYWSFTGLIRLG